MTTPSSPNPLPPRDQAIPEYAQWLYAHLGADTDLAYRLTESRLTPWDIVLLDHPDAYRILEEGLPLDHDEDDDPVLAYPRFDPAVLREAAEWEWPPNEIAEGDGFPGPLNRRVALYKAGVHPTMAVSIGWTVESGVEMIPALDARLAGTTVGPLRIADADVGVTLSVSGATVIGNVAAVRAFESLGGAPSPALEVLRIWDEVAAPRWPEHLDIRRRYSLLEILDSERLTTPGLGPSGLLVFNHFASLLTSVHLGRLRAVAATIPSFEDAFAAEHYGASASPSNWWP